MNTLSLARIMNRTWWMATLLVAIVGFCGVVLFLTVSLWGSALMWMLVIVAAEWPSLPNAHWGSVAMQYLSFILINLAVFSSGYLALLRLRLVHRGLARRGKWSSIAVGLIGAYALIGVGARLGGLAIQEHPGRAASVVPMPVDAESKTRSAFDQVPPIAAVRPDPQPNKVESHGMTWGAVPADGRNPDASFIASCHAEPKHPMDQLWRGSCNPYVGDTACSAELPVLCYSPAQNTLRATDPIRGRSLEGSAASDALCAARFGEGWRMAEHHDGYWGISARGTPPERPTRFWVRINDQPGNCWNSR